VVSRVMKRMRNPNDRCALFACNKT
jgi:hypothetical protein